jgi:hypothetical protein
MFSVTKSIFIAYSKMSGLTLVRRLAGEYETVDITPAEKRLTSKGPICGQDSLFYEVKKSSA